MNLNDNHETPLWQLGASATASHIRDRKISCVEVITAAVERIRTQNPHANAITVDLSETALAEAERADRALREGEIPGALYGVPVTIKENVDQAGQSTPNGLSQLVSALATDDAPVVRNLRRAGAIIIGRTNTPEFSLRYFTDNPLRGLTRNPRDPGATSGGSSGGAAVAVSLGMGCIAHGNDLIGSLRYPSYCCGVVTIRPSFGRVPAYNPSQQSERSPLLQMMSVQGPIAREVRDIRLALKAMSQRDSRDPWWVPAPLETGHPDCPRRVAVFYGFEDHRCEPEIEEVVRRAADHLSNAGYAVDEVTPPSLADARVYQLLFTEIDISIGDTIRALGSPDINAVINSYHETQPRLTFSAYVNGLAARAKYCRQWSLFMEDHPLVLCPVSLRKPFAVNEDLRGPATVSRILESNFLMAAANFLGLPAVSVPVDALSKTPLSVQLIGPRFREDLCLDAAQIIETACGVPSHSLWKNQ